MAKKHEPKEQTNKNRNALLSYKSVDDIKIVKTKNPPMQVEIRRPTMKRMDEIRRSVKLGYGNDGDVDGTRLNALLLIECCYDPDTNERLFQHEDIDDLMERPQYEWYVTLVRAIIDNVGEGVNIEAEKKPSDQTVRGTQHVS